jgi:hypothetical protein
MIPPPHGFASAEDFIGYQKNITFFDRELSFVNTQAGRPMSALGQKQTSDYRLLMSALPPKADIGTQSRNVRFVPIADSFVAAISAEPHREWSCHPEATPYEFLSAMEIEARAATKRNPKPSTQHRSGLGSLFPHFGF